MTSCSSPNAHAHNAHVVIARASSEGVLAVTVSNELPPTTHSDLQSTREEAVIRVSITNAELARKTTLAIANALSAVATPPPFPRVVRLRTRKGFERLRATDPSALASAIVNLRVPDRNPSRLPDLVDAIRASGVLGIQLVWDGETPTRERVEQHVFEALERARSKPAAPPVVLARTDAPSLHLRFLVAAQTGARQKGARALRQESDAHESASANATANASTSAIATTNGKDPNQKRAIESSIVAKEIITTKGSLPC